MTLTSFHEVRFPTDLARGATGGPERRTEVITLASGREQRNTRWAHSRRRFNAGYGIKTLADIQTVIDFFEERRGRLYGFRFRDPLDWKSSVGKNQPGPFDQRLGVGDGSTTKYQLIKRYGSAQTGYHRQIVKPVANSLVVAVGGNVLPGSAYGLNHTNGMVTFNAANIPKSGQEVRAGFEFDIPVRFDADEITVNLSHFEAGDIPSIPLVELLS